jgi:hypothetical protein
MDMNYHDIVQYAEIYLDSFPNDEHFAKRYGRWSGFWSPRVDASGDFDLTYRNMAGVLDGSPICGGDDGDWEQTGPIINTQNMGVIVTVASPQGQPNVIYAGSNTGGLWKTTNGGVSWTNVTDVLGVPGLGVNDILIHPTNPNILYIATGFNYSFVPQNYGVGVLKSTDSGVTWDNTELTWNPLTSTEPRRNLAINKLAFHPDNPNLIYALSHFEVHRWLDDNVAYGSIAANSHQVLTFTDNNGVIVSNDSKFLDIEFVKKPGINNNYEYDTYVSTSGIWLHSGKLYRSPDDGDNWSDIFIESPTGYLAHSQTEHDKINACVIESALNDPNNDTKLYVYYLYRRGAVSETTGTWTSPLFEYNHYAPVGINKWTPLHNNTGSQYRPEKEYTNFEVNPQNADIMYLPNKRIGKFDVGLGTLTSLIYGSFVSSNIHAEHRDLMINFTGASSYKIIVGNDGGVAVGTPITATNYTFQNINGTGNTSVENRLIASQCTDISISNKVTGIDKVILGGAVDNANYIKSNNNFLWENIGDVDGGQTAINETYGLAYIRVNGYFQIYNINTQSKVINGYGFDPGFGGSGYDDFAEIKIDRSNPNRFYIGKYKYFKGYELNSSFVPSLLTNIDFNFTSLLDQHYNTSISCFEIDPKHPNKILLAFNQGTDFGVQWNPRFFKSNDYGNTWNVIGNTVSNPTGPFMLDVDDGTGTGAKNTLNPIEDNYITDICYSTDDDGFVWASISRWATDEATKISGIPVVNSRVIFSNDGGDTWEDFSEGLTSAPVNGLVYQEGSGGVLFAATDVGVYRYNPTPGIEKWECFNQGFPVSLVNDLEISNCEQKIYASAYGRGIWESALPPLERCDITANTPWDTDREVLATTVVKTGKTLTIENCTVNIARGASIIVEPGAKLVIHNATLTNTCGEMWDGIIVQGDATASQSNSAQGTLITRVNSRIEYANDAIRVWDPIDGGGLSQAGGIIQAKRTTFLNNRRDVEFMKYDLGVDNRSTFIQCTFKLDDDYRGTLLDLDDRVTMWHVNGVKFAGCTFEMNNADFDGNHQRSGIYSIDAGYYVGASCYGLAGYPCIDDPVLIRSNFKNLYYGVRASATNNKTIRVNKTDFEKNVYGVLVEEMDNIQVTESTFDVGSGSGPNFGNFVNVGIAIYSGTGYEVQENIFTDDGLYNYPYAAGVHILNTGAAGNKIYKNTFSGLFRANSAVGVNNSLNYQTGLQYLCNNHSNNNNDIVVENGPGIREFQGEPAPTLTEDNISDGNLFPDYNSTTERNYSVEYGVAHGITRFHISGELANDVTGNGQVDQIILNTISNGCPSELDDLDEVTVIAGRAGKSNDYTINETAYNNSLYLYDNLIDGGNTQGLSNNIQYNWSNDAWQMRSELIAESPNLSEEVLLDAAFTGTLPDALLMEVLLANPRSVKRSEFHEILLNEIPNPLPQYMVDMLPFAAETPSMRATLEKQIVHYGYKKSNAAKFLVHYALRDSIIELDTVKYWLEKDITPKGRFALAEHYLSRGQYTMAQNMLNNVETEFERYFEYQTTAYQAYQQLMTLKVSILQNGRTWLDITESEKSTLQTIAYETNDDAAFQARNILCFFFDECVDEPINLANTTSAARIIQVENPMLELTQNLTNLKVYPNPATDYVTFDYEFPEYVETATIVITTIKGDVIQQFDLEKNKNQILWDTRSIENGIYFYALKQGKNTLVSSKVSILK